MKVATVIVGTDEERFRCIAANAERLALAESIAEYVETRRVDLCVMPAGYLAASSRKRSAVERTAGQLAAIFDGVDLVAGVDVARTLSSPKRRVAHKATRHVSGLPYWGFTSHRGKDVEVHQQRTVAPGETTSDTTARVAEVGGRRVGLLICGEVYNYALTESLGRARPDLVVDIGHRSMGRHFTATLRNAAAAVGCCLLHAQHVAFGSRGGSKWTATTRRAWAENDADWTSYAVDDRRAALWAEVKLWKVDG